MKTELSITNRFEIPCIENYFCQRLMVSGGGHSPYREKFLHIMLLLSYQNSFQTIFIALAAQGSYHVISFWHRVNKYWRFSRLTDLL